MTISILKINRSNSSELARPYFFKLVKDLKKRAPANLLNTLK